MEQTYIMLADQVHDLTQERQWIQTVEGRITLDATIHHLSQARDTLRRAIAAEEKMADKLYDQ